jgi:hypothetical protein
MFLNLNIQHCFNGLNPDPVGHISRSFTTKNKKLIGEFNIFVASDWSKQKISERIKIMEKISKLPTNRVNREKMQSSWDKLNLEIGNIFKGGKKCPNIPSKTREWSPAFAKSGTKCQYWKARQKTIQILLYSGRIYSISTTGD